MVKAVIFDLDGVLVDATEWHYEALNRALALFGYTITRQEHLSTYNGLPTRKKLEMLSREKSLPAALHDFLNRIKQEYTYEEINKSCKPNFQKQYMLSKLKKEGYRLVVCSNSIRKSLELMLQKSGISEYFEFVLSNQDVSNPKPHPEMYQKAIEKLGIRPEDAIIVEDAPHGIAAAKAACPNVLEVKGYPDVYYDRVREYLDIVEKR